MTPLTSKQRRHLKSLAQRLDATLSIGKLGLTDSFIKTANETFALHELLKVRLSNLKEQKQTLAVELAQRTASHLVCIIGHVAVLYRQKPTPSVTGVNNSISSASKVADG
ncbi:MAG: YhbY family RNA-binding protein [Pedosphaera sp.]|nr:YhbY family RNA-binding protein [Pedosphaera sp.]